MSGSKTNTMSRKDVLEAVHHLPPESDFVWDGVTEDERPTTAQELQAGLVAYLQQRTQAAGSDSKEPVALRLDQDILTAFQSAGPGWQTRINHALRDWLKNHPLT